MDDKIIALAKQTAAPRLKDLDAPLALGLHELRHKWRGNGGMFHYLAERYMQEVGRRAVVVWEGLHRAYLSADAPLSDTLRQDLQEAVRAGLDAIVTELRPGFDKDMEHAPQPKDTNWANRLGDARDREFARFSAEIEHYVTSLETARNRGVVPSTQYNFHAPVGAVVTGAGANANVVQNITNAQRDDLLKAIDEVNKIIDRAPELLAKDREELIEIADEARNEVSKAKPNTRRLSMVLQNLAAAVQGIANGPQAGEVLRAAAAAIGISW